MSNVLLDVIGSDFCAISLIITTGLISLSTQADVDNVFDGANNLLIFFDQDSASVSRKYEG